jgi:hypothetical protein
MTSALPNALDTHIQDRSPQRFTPSPLREEQRVLTRVLRCSVEELLARLGAENAIKRVETELRRARRARSRKLHTFWSAVLIRIETETDAAEHESRRKRAASGRAG